MLQFLQRVGEQVGGWLYVIAGFLAFGEAALMIGVVLPGETALLVAGFAAQQGYIRLWPMIAVAVGAAVLGDSVGYQIGRIPGPALRRSRLGRWIGPARWDSADAFLGRHGGKAVLLGRFTAVLRALTPGIAGMARMPYLRTFLSWTSSAARCGDGMCAPWLRLLCLAGHRRSIPGLGTAAAHRARNGRAFPGPRDPPQADGNGSSVVSRQRTRIPRV